MRKRFLSSIIALALALAAAVLPAGPAMEAYAGSALDDVKFNMTVTGLDEYNDVWLNLSFSYSGIGGGYDDYGVELYDSSKFHVAGHSTQQSGSSNAATVVDNINIKRDLRYDLSYSMRYYCRIWVDFGVEKVYSPYYSFTTVGDPKTPPVWKTVKLSAAKAEAGTPVELTHEATGANMYVIIAESQTGEQIYFNMQGPDDTKDSIVIEEPGRCYVFCRAVNDYGVIESTRFPLDITAKPSSVKLSAGHSAVEDTTADIYVSVNAENMLPYTRLGAEIYDDAGKRIAYYFKEQSAAYAKASSYSESIKFNIGVDAKVWLQSGKKYSYKPFVIINGTTYSDAGGSFVAGDNSTGGNGGSGSGSGSSGQQGTVPAAGLPFTDVPQGKWYYSYVSRAYEEGLINGVTATTFAPDKSMTMAQVVALAARVRQLLTDGRITLENSISGGWYKSYYSYLNMRYALECREIDYTDYSRPVTRGEMARIFCDAIPPEYRPQRNTIADGAIPDVDPSQQVYGQAVYALYRAGIVAGSDDFGTYKPDTEIKRSEVAAILIRFIDAKARVGAPAKLGQQ